MGLNWKFVRKNKKYFFDMAGLWMLVLWSKSGLNCLDICFNSARLSSVARELWYHWIYMFTKKDPISSSGKTEQESLWLKASSLIFPAIYKNMLHLFSNGGFRSESVENVAIVIIKYFISWLVLSLQCGKGLSSPNLFIPERTVKYVHTHFPFIFPRIKNHCSHSSWCQPC